MIKKRLLAVFSVLALSACATSQPVQKEMLANKSMIIEQTGRTTYEYAATTGISNSLVQGGKPAELEKLFSDDSLTKIMANEAQKYIKIKYGYESIISKNHAFKDTFAKDWYKSNRPDLVDSSSMNQDLLIEVSVPFVFISTSLTTLCGDQLVGVRVIDRKSGSVIGRASAGSVTGCAFKSIEVSLPGVSGISTEALVAFKKSMETLTTKNTTLALEKIFPSK